MSVTVYHNPRCSKSRETIKLLQDKGIEFSTRLYLQDIPTVSEINALLELLGFSSARELMRQKEDAYKTLKLAAIDDEPTLVKALHEHPKLIERPIVVIDDKTAKIGRPPEAVLTLWE